MEWGKLYQEARKIVGAEMQHITYQYWIPHVFGRTAEELLGSYRGYDPNLDASISNVFATAALRFGHTLIQPQLQRLNESFQPIPQGPLKLRDAFFSPWRLVEEGGVDPLMRGMFGTAAKFEIARRKFELRTDGTIIPYCPCSGFRFSCDELSSGAEIMHCQVI